MPTIIEVMAKHKIEKMFKCPRFQLHGNLFTCMESSMKFALEVDCPNWNIHPSQGLINPAILVKQAPILVIAIQSQSFCHQIKIIYFLNYIIVSSVSYFGQMWSQFTIRCKVSS